MNCKPCDCGGDCAEQQKPYLGEKVGGKASCARCDEYARRLLRVGNVAPVKPTCPECGEKPIILDTVVVAPPADVPVPRVVMAPLEAIQRLVFAVLKKLNVKVA